MNDEKFEEFNGAGGKKAFGRSGFDSCFGVLIAAEGGSIVGHYNPDINQVNRAKKNLLDCTSNMKTSCEVPLHISVSVDAYAPEQFLDQELSTRMINMFKNELQMNPHIVRYTEASALVMDKNGEIVNALKGLKCRAGCWSLEVEARSRRLTLSRKICS